MKKYKLAFLIDDTFHLLEDLDKEEIKELKKEYQIFKVEEKRYVPDFLDNESVVNDIYNDLEKLGVDGYDLDYLYKDKKLKNLINEFNKELARVIDVIYYEKVGIYNDSN